MSRSNDDEERESLQKRQKRQEVIAKRGSIVPQQIVELLRSNNNRVKDRRKNPYLLYMIKDYQFLLSGSKGWMGRRIKRWPKKQLKSRAQHEMKEQIQYFDQDPPEVQQFVPSPQKKRYVALKTKFCNKHECIWRSLDYTQEFRFIKYKFQGSDS
jgi:hypothetical protein